MKSRMLRTVCLGAVAVMVVGLVWGRMFASQGDHSRMAAAGRGAHASHKTHTATLKQALEAIEAARQAVQADDKAKALAALARARALVTTSHHAMVRANGIVNARCPIMGSKKLDPAMVPENLTRIYKDKSVGFCCKNCPKAWDKLSGRDKEQKLRQSGTAAGHGMNMNMDKGKGMKMGKGKGHGESKSPQVFTCAMHPKVKRSEPGQCPQCGMKLAPS